MNYIGSKKHLLDFIQNCIKKQVGSIDDKVFCDLFAGTGVVGAHFKNRVKKVIANDIEPYAYTIIYNKIKNSSTYDLNNIRYEPKEGFIYKNYALKRSYFSKENAKKIDGLREAIEKSFTCKKITKDQYYYCLASLLFSADRVANTTGVYGSFLKNMKFMAKTKLKLLAHEFELSDNEHEVYNENANELIKKIKGDILYLDPPYNHRQYGLNYHILNTIVKNTEFKPRGISGFDDYIRSDYCKKNRVETALDELIKEAKFKYIFLSYSDDGILDKMSIEKIMSKYGSYSLEKCNHSRYRTNKKSTKGCVVEYLHVVKKMHCDYFGICGSCKVYELSYEEQVNKKIAFMKELFEPLHVKDIEVFTSPDTHYRNRAEFRIWHDEDEMNYAMNKLEGKDVVQIKSCPKVTIKIAKLMEPLRLMIKKNEVLRKKLFSIEFLSSSTKVLVSLLYHKKIDESWDIHAKELEKEFGIAVIGRSKKVKRVISDDFVIDELHVNKKPYIYKIIEGGFSQPNSFVNAKMIEWATLHVNNPQDLLELYCGHGNFTIPFAKQFNKVLATEISKSSIKSAKFSCEMNGVANIEFLRMSVEDLTSALKKEREFVRLKDINLDDYNFSHVFVDPPRAGIDEKSLEFISQFETIIYISCNPLTLKRDLDFLKDQFKIQNFALFDQFPHTNHIESGVILKKL